MKQVADIFQTGPQSSLALPSGGQRWWRQNLWKWLSFWYLCLQHGISPLKAQVIWNNWVNWTGFHQILQVRAKAHAPQLPMILKSYPSCWSCVCRPHIFYAFNCFGTSTAIFVSICVFTSKNIFKEYFSKSEHHSFNSFKLQFTVLLLQFLGDVSISACWMPT